MKLALVFIALFATVCVASSRLLSRTRPHMNYEETNLLKRLVKRQAFNGKNLQKTSDQKNSSIKFRSKLWSPCMCCTELWQRFYRNSPTGWMLWKMRTMGICKKRRTCISTRPTSSTGSSKSTTSLWSIQSTKSC